MVSIAAFQAVDPGSIPGRRICFHFFPHPHAKGLGSELEALCDSQFPWLGIFSLCTRWLRRAPVVLMDPHIDSFLLNSSVNEKKK